MTESHNSKMRHAWDDLSNARALLMQKSVTLTDLRLAVTHAQNATAKLNLLAGILEGQPQPTTGEPK